MWFTFHSKNIVQRFFSFDFRLVFEKNEANKSSRRRLLHNRNHENNAGQLVHEPNGD